jgi:hypothetical protein
LINKFYLFPQPIEEEMRWRSWLEKDPTEWLLEDPDPCVRYHVLLYVLDRPDSSAEVREAREAMTHQGIVERILAKQGPEGCWGRPGDFYERSKYRGTVWNLILLADLEANPEDLRVRRAGEFILQWSRKEDGTFCHIGGPQGGTNGSLPCLTANMAFALGRLGFADDPRWKRSLNSIVDRHAGLPVECLRERCLDCRSGLVKELKALALAPEEDRGPAVRSTQLLLAEVIAARCLPEAGRASKARKEWYRLGFPLFYNTDLLEIVDLLARSGYKASDLRPALDIILSKPDREGRWTNEHAFPKRTLTRIEGDGEPSRWVTLRVIRMLNALPE